MCKYCHRLFTGLPANEFIVKGDINVNNKPIFETWVIIEERNGGAYIVEEIWSYGEIVYREMTKIHYCPMCGRKLTEKES